MQEGDRREGRLLEREEKERGHVSKSQAVREKERGKREVARGRAGRRWQCNK